MLAQKVAGRILHCYYSPLWNFPKMAPGSELKYYPAFDYLRIVLALSVAAGHAGIHGWEQSGNSAVQVFFAMSGWLIGAILLNSSLKDLARFYFNRAARIWIPYFLTILLLIVVSLVKEPLTRKWVEIFYDLTFTYNFFGPPQPAEFMHQMPLDGTGQHLWSIRAEEQLYLVAPLLLVLGGTAGRSISLWLPIAAGLLASRYSPYFGAISLGVLCAISRLHSGDWQSGRIAPAVVLVLAVATFALTVSAWLPYEVGAPFTAIFTLLTCAQYGASTPLEQWVGGVSYPLYLNHWTGIFIANALLGRIGLRGTIADSIVAIIFAVAIAALLYALVDRRVMARRPRYFTEQRGRLLAALGFTLIAIGFAGAYIYGRF